MTDEIEEVIEALHAAGDAADMGNYPEPAWFNRQAERLKESREENVDDALSVTLDVDTSDLEESIEEAQEKLSELERSAEDAQKAVEGIGMKRTNVRVITEPRDDDE